MPARPLHDTSANTPAAAAAIQSFHAEIVREVADAVAREPVVVVGMKQNPVVKSVRAALEKAGIKYCYLEYGSYFSQWKQRLAIKMWSGWPTYPQVFVRGVLVGGNQETQEALVAGDLVNWIENGPPRA